MQFFEKSVFNVRTRFGLAWLLLALHCFLTLGLENAGASINDFISQFEAVSLSKFLARRSSKPWDGILTSRIQATGCTVYMF